MKKVFLSLIGLPIFLFCDVNGWITKNTVAVNTSSFYSFEHEFRGIYGHYNLMVVTELEQYTAHPAIHLFEEMGFLYKEGKVDEMIGNSTILFLPLSIGIKHCLNNCMGTYLNPFIKFGPTFYYLETRQDTPFVEDKEYICGVGGTVGIGNRMISSCRNFFCDFLFQAYGIRKSYKNHNADVELDLGGFRLGMSLGMCF